MGLHPLPARPPPDVLNSLALTVGPSAAGLGEPSSRGCKGGCGQRRRQRETSRHPLDGSLISQKTEVGEARKRQLGLGGTVARACFPVCVLLSYLVTGRTSQGEVPQRGVSTWPVWEWGWELGELWPQNHTLFRLPPFPGPVALGALGARSLKPNSFLEGFVCLLPGGRTGELQEGEAGDSRRSGRPRVCLLTRRVISHYVGGVVWEPCPVLRPPGCPRGQQPDSRSVPRCRRRQVGTEPARPEAALLPQG